MRRRLLLEELPVRDVPAVYYVATGGSNGAAGSSGSPWQTLQYAANQVGPGDQVIVRAGTYAGFLVETDGTAADRIRFTAEAGVTLATPNPAGPHAGRDGINLEGADYITVEGFRVIGMPRAGIRSVENTGVVIRNNVCDDNTVWGILTGFSENITIEGNECSRSHEQHGIYFGNSADNAVIRGNISWGNNDCGIHVNSDVWAGGDGIISNALIENNLIYDNGTGGGAAINMDGVQNSRIQNNLLYNNRAGGITLFRQDGAEGAKNNVVANNTILTAANGGRWAIAISGGSTGNTLLNNILWTDHFWRGSLSVAEDSLDGLYSDYNVLMDRMSVDDGGSRITLAEWQARPGAGQDEHSILSTPAALFANAAQNVYQLAAASPALNGGAAVVSGRAAPAVDRLGTARPANGGYDAGAYELPAVTPPPVANPDAYGTPAGTPLVIPAATGVLANDTPGGGLTAVPEAGPAHGALTLNPDGSFTYTPAAGYHGSDSFTYRATDGTNTSEPATVTVAVNGPPVAVNDAYSTDEDTPRTVAAAAGVLAGDTDPEGAPLTAVLVGNVQHGALTLNADGSFTYTPAANYTGPDSFTYRASDGLMISNLATVTITVRPVNDAPVAVGDAYSTDEDVPLVVGTPGVWGNDTDIEGAALTVVPGTGPAHGALTLNANGSFTYAPAANYHGTDSFTYTVSDGAATSSPATVTLTVRSVNDAPTAGDDSATAMLKRAVTIPVLANDTDPDGEPLTIRSFTPPAKGSLKRVGSALVYTATGSRTGTDSFTYTAADDAGVTTTATVRLTLTDPAAPALKAVRARHGAAGTADLMSFGRTVLPWADLSRFDLSFSEFVTLPAAALTLAGPGGAVPLTLTTNPAGGLTASWTFPVLAPGTYTLRLSGAAVQDLNGNPLRGDYTRRFDVLPGDFDGNGLVDGRDLTGIKRKYQATPAKADRFADVNGDGVVNVQDYNLAKAALGTRL